MTVVLLELYTQKGVNASWDVNIVSTVTLSIQDPPPSPMLCKHQLQNRWLEQNTFYLIPSYSFNRSDKIVQWDTCVDCIKDNFKMYLQVYRPNKVTNCYSLVGYNVFRQNESLVQQQCFSYNVRNDSQLEVMPGDVLAFYTAGTRVAVCTNSSIMLWYAALSSLIVTGNPACQFRIGSTGNLLPLRAGLPMVTAITGAYENSRYFIYEYQLLYL